MDAAKTLVGDGESEEVTGVAKRSRTDARTWRALMNR
jgi:hypothetical protein